MMDELELIRSSMASIPDPSEETVSGLRAQLDALIAEETAQLGHRPHGRLRSRRRGFAVAVLVAAAAALVTVFTLPSSPGGPSSAAASMLTHLADVAAAQPATTPPGPGQFQYTESDEAYEDCTSGAPPSTIAGSSFSTAPSANYCALLPEHRQIWLGADNSGRILETFGQPDFLSATDRAAWEAVGGPPLSNGTSDTTFGPHTMADGPPNFSTLPTDPATLGAMLSARKIEGGPPGPAEDFVQVGDLLRETDASPALRSALYQVAAAIAGVELLGNTADHSGRMGIGIGYVNRGVRHVLIFDPTTSALLGEEDIATSDHASGYNVSAGTVIDWAVYLSSGIVNSISDTPTGTVSHTPTENCVAQNPTNGTKGGPGASAPPQHSAGSASEPAICHQNGTS
jgi:hypothetical protein